jgi:hypothetical protein
LGLTIRTIQRWEVQGLTDNRKGSRAVPGNKLSDHEKARIINVLESPRFSDYNPNQIIPRLADQGIYLGSESTMYRILRELKMNRHRQSRHSKDNHTLLFFKLKMLALHETMRGMSTFLNPSKIDSFRSSVTNKD